MHRLVKNISILFWLFIASQAMATEPEELVYTSYAFADYGMGTYKSELMESNDTNAILNYGLGVYAGAERTLGFEYGIESAATTFELSSSVLTMKWESTTIKYRLWLFELGPVLGSVTAKGERNSEEIFDAVGRGYGGYFGLRMPMDRRGSIDLKAMQVSTGEMIDKKERKIAIGPRLDLELSGRIALTRKTTSVVIGYRRRTYSITEDTTAYQELQTSTFLGLLVGTTF